ncbi:hypothetical protein CBL_07905 [Carabus blaptoides fortunei]
MAGQAMNERVAWVDVARCHGTYKSCDSRDKQGNLHNLVLQLRAYVQQSAQKPLGQTDLHMHSLAVVCGTGYQIRRVVKSRLLYPTIPMLHRCRLPPINHWRPIRRGLGGRVPLLGSQCEKANAR